MIHHPPKSRYDKGQKSRLNPLYGSWVADMEVRKFNQFPETGMAETSFSITC